MHTAGGGRRLTGIKVWDWSVVAAIDDTGLGL